MSTFNTYKEEYTKHNTNTQNVYLGEWRPLKGLAWEHFQRESRIPLWEGWEESGQKSTQAQSWLEPWGLGYEYAQYLANTERI